MAERSEDVDLRELFAILWSGKWIIGGVSFAAALLSVAVALWLPNIYRAEALLAPNDQGSGSALSSLAAQYGGLASLAGINLSGGETDQTALGLEVLRSKKFITEFIDRHDLLVPLIAAKGWDAGTGELIIDEDDYDLETATWIRKVGPPKKTIPTLQEAYREFMEILSVYQDKRTGFVSVSVDHYSPTVAKEWVDWLVSDLNRTIMEKDVAEAEQAIEFLNKQIENTSLMELRGVFFSLIEEQTKTIMLANVTDEYLLKTIDPALAPERKIAPKRALIVLLATAFGSIFGVFVLLVLRSR